MSFLETPIILAQNILFNSELSANSVFSHEIERLRDGYQHTWWQAPSTGLQDIVLEAENKIINPDFEVNTSPWTELAAGGAGTFARNTVSPLFGDADALLTVVTANPTSQLYLIYNLKSLDMIEGRTYRIQFAAKVQDASSKTIRFGFLTEGFIQDPDLYLDNASVSTSAIGLHADFVAPKTQSVYPFIRALESQTLQLDEFNANEVRDIDTLMVSGGHTMRLGTFQVQNRAIPAAFGGGWANVTTPILWKNDHPVYIPFTGSKALSWRLRITVWLFSPHTPVAQIPILYLGKRWELDDINFVSSYDDQQRNRFENRIVGEKGTEFNNLKYNQRVVKATLSPIVDAGYDNLDRFFEDTVNGSRPFFYIRQPISQLDDILYIRMRRGENVPFQTAGIRTWALDAEEIAGERII